MHNYTSIPCITDTEPGFWSGKRVLVRADLNIPPAETPSDWLRVEALVPTIQFLMEQHARVVIISHRADNMSLASVASYLERHFTIRFEPHVTPQEPDSYMGGWARTGIVTIAENVRFDHREEAESEEFAAELARGFDVFVQDAFSACHRSHTSITLVPQKLPTYIGIQMQREITHLAGLADRDDSVVIIGGAKFDTKLPLIERFLERSRMVIVGGALAHAIYKSRGYEIGNSLCDDSVSVAHIARHPKIFVPQYVLVERDGQTMELLATDVLAGDVIVDAGSGSFGILEREIRTAPVVLWNGPLGWYERGYFSATKTLAGIIAENENETIVGGGDTISTLHTLDALGKFTFVSMAGGAMLEFLSTGSLVGLDAIIAAKSS